jgi:hypothetical protein
VDTREKGEKESYQLFLELVMGRGAPESDDCTMNAVRCRNSSEDLSDYTFIYSVCTLIMVYLNYDDYYSCSTENAI